MVRNSILFAMLAGLLASPGLAAEPLICVFFQECVGEGECRIDAPIEMGFQPQGDVWVMQGADGSATNFTRLPGKSAGMRSFVAENADPAAAAVSILSIFEDGQAFLSTHGIFLTPGFVTHIGTCVPEGQ